MLGSKSQKLQEIEDLNCAIVISIKENEEESGKYPTLEQNSFLEDSKNTSMDQFNETIVGIKRNQSTGSDDVPLKSKASFSALNDSVNESPFQPKAASKVSNLDQFSKQMKVLNQSFFTDKKQFQQSLRARPAPQIHEEQNQPINYGQSFYLTPPVNNKIQNKIAKDNEDQTKVIFRSKNYYIELHSESVEVNTQSLQDLYNELFKRELFVPLFSSQIFEHWNEIKDLHKKYDETSEAFIHLKIYLEHYVGYLNQYCLKQMEEVLKKVKEIQQSSGSSSIRDKKKQAFSYFQFDLKSLLENVKHMIAETKTEILLRTLLAKVKSMVQALKQREKYKLSAEQKLNLQKTIERTWIDVGNIQLLLSFQRTLDYCTKKIENSPQTKFRQIWIKYREIMTRQRSKFVAKLGLINL